MSGGGTIDEAIGAGDSKMSGTQAPYLVRPKEGINYNFVSSIYLGGSIIALSFYLLETLLLHSYLEDPSTVQGRESESEDGPLEELSRGLVGMYLIFVPFFPCFVWSCVVRHFWLISGEEDKTKAD